jgi:hypothetical protein
MVSMRRGFTAPAAEMMQWIGLILICIIMLYVIIHWASAGAHVQRGVEQGSLMYTIASSVNALSSMEEGEVTRYLSGSYDITVECDGACHVKTAAYDDAGRRQEESNEVIILGNAMPVSLSKVNKITLAKERDRSVVISGERTEDIFGVGLDISKYDPMCISRYRDLIKAASEKYGVEQELIAAVIQAESSWSPEDYRYEPGFQARELEGTNWERDGSWLGEGSPTIRQWFSQHPERNDYDDFRNRYPDKLDLVAQTRVSASYGLMQTMYTTAYISCGFRGSPETLKDPAASIDCGTKYLRDKLDQYGGSNYRDAVSAYNAGKKLWQENTQNRQYTARVLGYYDAYRACRA